ncbi:NOP protein chaperone 1 [Gouania willdenowi]|uniref:NOP protein chaperone 1 n=1 Tax=Gouania willdenowi TaxID=441366 RepID=UPI001054F964|nr:uncharacterized protein C12orf45 homolog [Gouania willdenowi]
MLRSLLNLKRALFKSASSLTRKYFSPITHGRWRENTAVCEKDLNMLKNQNTSQDLMTCGSGTGLSEKLLLKPKAASSLQTERVPRSNMLARLQTFLPQMAEANEKLRLQMEETPAEHFDIERVEEGQRVIEMDVGVFQLDGSDSDCEEDTSDSDSDEDVSVKITEQNLKLPGHKAKKKVDIQVLEQQQ